MASISGRAVEVPLVDLIAVSPKKGVKSPKSRNSPNSAKAGSSGLGSPKSRSGGVAAVLFGSPPTVDSELAKDQVGHMDVSPPSDVTTFRPPSDRLQTAFRRDHQLERILDR